MTKIGDATERTQAIDRLTDRIRDEILATSSRITPNDAWIAAENIVRELGITASYTEPVAGYLGGSAGGWNYYIGWAPTDGSEPTTEGAQ